MKLQSPPNFASRQFANNAHTEALNQYGDSDYVTHLDMVFESFISFPVQQNKLLSFSLSDLKSIYFPDVIYLHDVLQNTSVCMKEIESEFSRTVAKAVSFLTKPDGQNRKDRVLQHNKKLSSLSVFVLEEYLALVVAVYERYANVNHAYLNSDKKKIKMYTEEHHAFKQSAYRFGIADAVWSELDNLIES